MHEQPNHNIHEDANHETGQDTEGCLQRGEILDFLEASNGQKVRTAWHGEDAYNRAANSSIELSTPFDMATMAQIVENEVFAHIEFGINAGLFRLV